MSNHSCSSSHCHHRIFPADIEQLIQKGACLRQFDSLVASFYKYKLCEATQQ